MFNFLKKKERKELTLEQYFGIFHPLPNHVIVTHVLSFFEPHELLTILGTLNTRWNDLCFSDEVWIRKIENEIFSPMMKLTPIKPFFQFYRDAKTYWRMTPFTKGEEKKRYKVSSDGMTVVAKKMKSANTSTLKPIITHNRIDSRWNQLFRVQLKSSYLSGCSVVMARPDHSVVLKYHHDGSISRKIPGMTLDNRVQEIEEEDGSKNRVKVMIPLEQRFVFNIFVDNDNSRFHFFFNENFEEKITCSFEREIVDEGLHFGFDKLNVNQEVVVLSSVRSHVEYPEKKKMKRVYKA